MDYKIKLPSYYTTALNTLKEQMNTTHEILKQISEVTEPIRSLHGHISAISEPLQKYNQRIAQIMKPIQKQPELIKNLSNSFINVQGYFDLLNKQYDVLKTWNNNSSFLDETSSFKFTNTVVDIIDILDETKQEISPHLNETKQILIDNSKKGKKLTWEQILTIILFIYSTITFVSSLLPNQDPKAVHQEIVDSNELSSRILQKLDMLIDLQSQAIEQYEE